MIKKVVDSDPAKEEEGEVQDGQEDKRQEPPNPHAPLEDDDDGESVQVEKVRLTSSHCFINKRKRGSVLVSDKLILLPSRKKRQRAS